MASTSDYALFIRGEFNERVTTSMYLHLSGEYCQPKGSREKALLYSQKNKFFSVHSVALLFSCTVGHKSHDPCFLVLLMESKGHYFCGPLNT